MLIDLRDARDMDDLKNNITRKSLTTEFTVIRSRPEIITQETQTGEYTFVPSMMHMEAQDTILHVFGSSDEEIITFQFYSGENVPTKTQTIKLKRNEFYQAAKVVDTRPLLQQDKNTLFVMLTRHHLKCH